MFAGQGKGSSFATLTFSPEFLPRDLSVSVEFVQAFHKRLRHKVGPFRFLLGAEYGDRDQRPHYHVVYFGLDFREDRYPWKRSGSGELLYRSPTLESVWTYGHCLIGDVNLRSIRYSTQYAVKVVGGEMADAKYRRVDPETGETWHVRPEFRLASRNPGLGASWFDKYAGDCFPADFLIVEGRKVPVPRYYFLKLPPEQQAAIQVERKRRGVERVSDIKDPGEAALSREDRAQREAGRAKLSAGYRGDNTERRLFARHHVGLLREARLVRSLDEES